MTDPEKLLSGSDLRSLGKSGSLLNQIRSQREFDELFSFLFHHNRMVIMRAADVLEKVTVKFPEFLQMHKSEIIGLAKTETNKELQWHLALMLPRLKLNKTEVKWVRNKLTDWATDKNNSRIVRVNSIQGLYELYKYKLLDTDLVLPVLNELKKERIPSINARIKRFLFDKKNY